MTDQERAVQHWPDGWAERNLPGLTRLRQHGLTFTRAFTNTCQCSPARATLFTGTYPAVHGVTRTSGTLTPGFQNLARILGTAGYEVVYKGKWHLNTRYLSTTPEQAPGFDQALAQDYGFQGWNAPDAGTSLAAVATMGGGKAGNDRRYVQEMSPGGAEGVLQYLESRRKPRGGPRSGPPFCLVASLVNPHDVSVFPKLLDFAGYSLGDFASLPIDLPPNYGDDLATKPGVQAWFRDHAVFLGHLESDEQRLQYVRFYAYLHTLTDALIQQILDTLDAAGLTDDTLVVRLSDHGEMGLSHAGLRQKVYTVYEEALRVPLIVSHPGLFPRPVETDALASLIDLLPTLTTVAGLPNDGRWNFQGVDLSPVLKDPGRSVQDSIFYTFDDQLGAVAPYPSHIRALRESDWKYALYFDPDSKAQQFELYHLTDDPLELHNLADDPAFAGERQRLDALLRQKMAATGATTDRTEPQGSLADPVMGPRR
jgi:arylsulfatase A-like enzyme